MSPSKKVTKKVSKKEKLLREKLLPKFVLIESLKKCPKDARSRLINYLNKDGLNVLSETIHNCLRKEAPLKERQKKRMRKEYKKDKEVLFEIAKKRGSLKKKKELLKQSGGFLGTLLGEYNKIDIF